MYSKQGTDTVLFSLADDYVLANKYLYNPGYFIANTLGCPMVHAICLGF
jgi:hypothetical protein